MTQWKDKAGKNREGASVGLFTYPVLPSRRHSGVSGDACPCGEDQKQHLELARDIATKFNLDFGVELFPLPEPMIPEDTPRIMSLRDGTAKISRPSSARPRPIPNPCPPKVAGLAERPEARNLVTIYAALSGETSQDVLANFGGQGFGAFKPALADLAVAKLGPIRDRLVALLDDRAAVGATLAKGAAKADALARPTLLAAQQALGTASLNICFS
ncbi:hypothetical protein SASPL_157687 [Salvia splendens]|uniref:Tryptophanyl-tRNA synthetase n=1 Tax=Salvia splendens TaxID=180675 RepID=A0A8X8VUJ4_SALSN|nr:hypothetical protein SASPL_157687 [Salvia splendens]